MCTFFAGWLSFDYGLHFFIGRGKKSRQNVLGSGWRSRVIHFQVARKILVEPNDYMCAFSPKLNEHNLSLRTGRVFQTLIHLYVWSVGTGERYHRNRHAIGKVFSLRIMMTQSIAIAQNLFKRLSIITWAWEKDIAFWGLNPIVLGLWSSLVQMQEKQRQFPQRFARRLHQVGKSYLKATFSLPDEASGWIVVEIVFVLPVY